MNKSDIIYLKIWFDLEVWLKFKERSKNDSKLNALINTHIVDADKRNQLLTTFKYAQAIINRPIDLQDTNMVPTGILMLDQQQLEKEWEAYQKWRQSDDGKQYKQDFFAKNMYDPRIVIPTSPKYKDRYVVVLNIPEKYDNTCLSLMTIGTMLWTYSDHIDYMSWLRKKGGEF